MDSPRNLLILEFASLGKTYEAAQRVEAPIEILELIPGGESGVLLLTGPVEALQDFAAKYGLKVDLLEGTAAVALQAYLGLDNPPLQESLVIFESPSVGALFKAAQGLSEKGFKPFDVRVLRSGKPRGYVLATGPVTQTSELVPIERRGNWTLIASPSKALRELFEAAH